MGDLTLPLVGLTTLAGYFFSKEGKAPRNNTQTRSKVEAFDKPNGSTIYSSNMVEEANKEVLQRSMKNYKDAQNPAETGVLPPLYNTYSAVGNESMLSPIVSTNFNQYNSIDKAKMNDINRLKDVTQNTSNSIDLDARPMFRSLTDFVGRETTPQFEGEVSLLTGLPIRREHNNMVPFFGSNVKQNLEEFTNQPLLDLHTGNTSTFVHKKEVQPFFSQKPENIYGNPVFSASVNTERYIPSLYRQNEIPFDKERISAPIANTVDNPIKPLYKTVNELRPGNKPKDTYEGRIVAGQRSSVRGVQSEMVKRRPDTFYEATPGHYFTTVGEYIAPEAPRNYRTNFKNTSRQDQNISFFGNAGQADTFKTTARTKSVYDNSDELVAALVQAPKRENFGNDFRRNVSGQKTVNDYGKSAITDYETERATTGLETHILNVNNRNKGVRTAQQDPVKTTLKETTLITDNTGNVKTRFDEGAIASFVAGLSNFDPKTTHKETLVDNKYLGQVQKSDGMGYIVNKYQAQTTNKEISTAKSSYSGNAGAIVSNAKVYSTYENPEKVRNAIHVDYKGNAGFTNETMSRQNYNNAEIRDAKEQLVSGERPSGPQNFQIASGSASFGDVSVSQNTLLKEREDSRDLLNVNQLQNIPNKDLLGISMKVRFDDNPEDEAFIDRADPTILTQLADNPFVLRNRIKD